MARNQERARVPGLGLFEASAGQRLGADPLGNQLADQRSGLDNSGATIGDGGEGGPAAHVHQRFKLLAFDCRGQVLLVELHDHRDVLGQAMMAQIAEHLVHRIDVLVEGLAPAVGDEHHAIRPGQHGAAGGRVIALARHRPQSETYIGVLDRTDREIEPITVQGPFAVRFDADEVGGMLAGGRTDGFQVGGLASQARTVIHDLEHKFTTNGIEMHKFRPW